MCINAMIHFLTHRVAQVVTVVLAGTVTVTLRMLRVVMEIIVKVRASNGVPLVIYNLAHWAEYVRVV